MPVEYGDQLLSWEQTTIMLTTISVIHRMTSLEAECGFNYFFLENLHFSICGYMFVRFLISTIVQIYWWTASFWPMPPYTNKLCRIKLQMILGNHYWCKHIRIVIFLNLDPKVSYSSYRMHDPLTVSITIRLAFSWIPSYIGFNNFTFNQLLQIVMLNGCDSIIFVWKLHPLCNLLYHCSS